MTTTLFIVGIVLALALAVMYGVWLFRLADALERRGHSRGWILMPQMALTILLIDLFVEWLAGRRAARRALREGVRAPR